MLTIRNRVSQSLWRQGYVLDEIFLLPKHTAWFWYPTSSCCGYWVCFTPGKVAGVWRCPLGYEWLKLYYWSAFMTCIKTTLILPLMPDLVTISYLIMGVIRMSFWLGWCEYYWVTALNCWRTRQQYQ